MGGTGGTEGEDCQVPLDHTDRKETKGRTDHEDRRERGALQDHKAWLEFLVPVGQWGTKVIVETLVCLGLKGNGEPRAHQQEGQCTCTWHTTLSHHFQFYSSTEYHKQTHQLYIIIITIVYLCTEILVCNHDKSEIVKLKCLIITGVHVRIYVTIAVHTYTM